ncbi:MAG: FKBP-type peptidyl-prolyl cis-trans isomerase [Crocinitomicaceae bacterium]|nr:FKBP-type peptidyl-prolyl cis-trans isomerase [Crocinitomicaceae bacterium]
MKRFNFFLFALASVLLFSCGSYSDDQLAEFDKKIEKHLKKKNIDCEKSSSGLYYKILEEGEGELIQFTNTVSVKYKGTFLNGNVFDEQTEPIELPVSDQINAWKELMLQLKKGSKAYMVAPPQLGYGEYKVEKIPSNSILVFELEIVDVL